MHLGPPPPTHTQKKNYITIVFFVNIMNIYLLYILLKTYLAQEHVYYMK